MKSQFPLIQVAVAFTVGVAAAGLCEQVLGRLGSHLWLALGTATWLFTAVGSKWGLPPIRTKWAYVLVSIGCMGGWAADIQWENWHTTSQWLTEAKNLEVWGYLVGEADEARLLPQRICVASNVGRCLQYSTLPTFTWMAANASVDTPQKTPLVVRALGWYEAPKQAGNPGAFNPLVSSIGSSSIGTFHAEKWEVQATRRFFAASWRLHWQEVINSVIPGETGSLVASIVLGGTAHLSSDTKDALQKAGLSHVASVSGLHVGLVASFIWALLRGNNGVRGWLGLLAVTLFVVVAEGRPPAIRALVGLVLAVVCRKLGRSSNPWLSLACAWLALLALNPALYTDLGLRLSFASVVGILAVTKPLLRPVGAQQATLTRVGHYFYNMLALSVGAQLGAAYFSIQAFNTWPVLGPLANLLGVPLALAVLLLGLLGSCLVGIGQVASQVPVVLHTLCGISTWFGYWALVAAGGCAAAFIGLCRFVAGLSWGVVEIPGLPPLSGFVWYVVLGSVSLYLQKRKLPGILSTLPGKQARQWLVLALVVGLVSVIITWPKVTQLKITFFDVGEGDAILIQTPGKRAVLVDAGGANRNWNAARIVLPQLRRRGVRHLDAIVSTHPHADHLGGMADVVRSRTVELAIDSGRPTSTLTYEDYRQTLAQRSVPVVIANTNDTLNIGDVQLQVLWPPSGAVVGADDINNSSVVLRVMYRNIAVLLMGDATWQVQEALLRHNAIGQVVLWKVPHQGAANSVSSRFLAAIKPAVSVISVGPNRYGHPNPQIITQLAARSLVCRTDKHGAIEFLTNGEKWSVRGYKGKECRMHDTVSVGGRSITFDTRSASP